MAEPGHGDYYLRLPDGSAWPDPEDPNEVQWRLRYAPDRGAELTAAFYMQAYRDFFATTGQRRELVVKMIREALKAKAVRHG
jgi:hypothetical protein